METKPKTFQVNAGSAALIEEKQEGAAPRFLLLVGPASKPVDAITPHCVWGANFQFSLVVPDSDYLYGVPIKVKYHLCGFTGFRRRSEATYAFWKARKEDFIRSFSQKLQTVAKTPEGRDFENMTKAGSLLVIARGTADAVFWNVEVIQVELGSGETDPFGPVESLIGK